MVPGLLQTEDYARAMIARDLWRTEQNVEFCVRARMERQQVLYRPLSAQFTFFLHENALRLNIGSAATMHEQLLALMLLDGLPHVTIRVVPDSATFGGAFRLFQFAQHQPLIYLDAYVCGLFLEDTEYVDCYRRLVPAVADASLDEGQSREYLATWASEYDRRRVLDRVEEEQH